MYFDIWDIPDYAINERVSNEPGFPIRAVSEEGPAVVKPAGGKIQNELPSILLLDSLNCITIVLATTGSVEEQIPSKPENNT